MHLYGHTPYCAFTTDANLNIAPAVTNNQTPVTPQKARSVLTSKVMQGLWWQYQV
jgi:hypothetical protein